MIHGWSAMSKIRQEVRNSDLVPRTDGVLYSEYFYTSKICPFKPSPDRERQSLLEMIIAFVLPFLFTTIHLSFNSSWLSDDLIVTCLILLLECTHCQGHSVLSSQVNS